MYAMLGTRPDLAYPVALLSRFSQNPTSQHWKAMVHVFRYLIATPSLGLHFCQGPTSLLGYTDSAYADDLDNSRSTAGHTFLLAGAAVFWKSQQQHRVCTSSAEAEYVSLSEGGKSGMSLRILLQQLGFPQLEPTILYCDNKAARALAINGKSSHATRQVRVNKHHIRELVEENQITVNDIRTNKMAADILTKALSHKPLQQCTTTLGMSSPLSLPAPPESPPLESGGVLD